MIPNMDSMNSLHQRGNEDNVPVNSGVVDMNRRNISPVPRINAGAVTRNQPERSLDSGARSVSPALSPSHAKKMKTYFSSLKNVIKQKPVI